MATPGVCKNLSKTHDAHSAHCSLAQYERKRNTERLILPQIRGKIILQRDKYVDHQHTVDDSPEHAKEDAWKRLHQMGRGEFKP